MVMVARPEMIDPQKFGVTVARNTGLTGDVPAFALSLRRASRRAVTIRRAGTVHRESVRVGPTRGEPSR